MLNVETFKNADKMKNKAQNKHIICKQQNEIKLNSNPLITASRLTALNL